MSYNDFDFDYTFVPAKDRVELLKEGEGTFRITQVTPKTSKAGNKMLEVQFTCRDSAGREAWVYDYLIATMGDEAGMKRLNTKIGNIAKAINKPEIDSPEYNKKRLVQDLLGHKGRCYIKVQEDKTGQYSDKNVISKFYPHEESREELIKKQVEEFDDKDLPF